MKAEKTQIDSRNIHRARAKGEAMFTIEFVVVSEDRPDQPRVVERMVSPRLFPYDVEHRARLVLRKAKRQPSANSPNGYRILDEEGRVIVRSWQSKTTLKPAS